MRIRIVDINFANSAATIEVTPGRAGSPLEHLRAFMSRCAALGLDNIRLYYSGETSPAAARQLETLCAAQHLQPPKPTPPEIDLGTSMRFGHLPKLHSSANMNSFTEYQMSFDDMDNVVNDLTTTIMLIGEAVDLDPRSQFKLRLCIYEMIVNTVEHGTFNVDYPEVSVRILFTGDNVEVSYADNATVFVADNTSAVDMVEEQIKSSSKRGLGLYLLNNICNDWNYERTDEWNVTTFILKINRDTTPVTER